MALIKTLNPQTGHYETSRPPRSPQSNPLVQSLLQRIKALESKVWALQQLSAP